MKIEDLVLSIEQMRHLQELGVEVKDTALAWVNARVGHNFVAPIGIIFHNDYIPTLTLQEILEMLPEPIEVECRIPSLFKLQISKNNISYSNAFNYVLNNEYGKSMIDNAYNMLCWCAENGYLNKE